jgi:hypothetical protein
MNLPAPSSRRASSGWVNHIPMQSPGSPPPSQASREPHGPVQLPCVGARPLTQGLGTP